MKYAFIERHRRDWPVSTQCSALDVSVRGFQQYLHRKKMPDKGAGRVSDMALLTHIKAIHAETRGAYGWPRIWRELRQRNVRVGKERDDAGQRHSGTLEAEVQSDDRQPSWLSDNLLNRNFQPERPDLVGDITYIATQDGWLYLAVVIDLFSRQVVGWAMGKRMTRHLVIDALTMAWFRRRPAEGLIFHSDQGSQYASSDFQATLHGYAMRGSMSRKGNCWEPVRVSEANTR